ncbi:hypothetical protein GCM10010358_19590 [Streptomyces minutiscleroticus]|uniref:Uncharacterized protein n=1 Tax=Streptomyces minutiscleroticus TaxID=68238 RepID=A0A918KJH6_9ACTN|nr:hypothetical protein GCM10010358_19590 [Streptomyces minutiscleroticus]
MAGLQVGEELGEGLPAALHGLLAVGVLAQDGGDADLDGHGWELLSGEGVDGRAAARESVRLARGKPRLTAVRRNVSTDGAGEPAQVDVQPRHEQGARGLIAHVVENHGVIVSIPGRDPGS